MAFMLSQQNNHYFQMSSNGTDSLLTFIIAFLMSKELKRSSVIGSVAFKCGAFTQLTFWRIVMFIKWHILLWIFIEVFLRRKRLGCGKNVCYHCYLSGAFGGIGNLAQYHFVGVCVCVFMCVCLCWGCFLTLIDVSLAVQLLQRSISVIHFLSFILQRNGRSLTDKSKEKRVGVKKYHSRTNIMLNWEGHGHKASGLSS